MNPSDSTPGLPEIPHVPGTPEAPGVPRTPDVQEVPPQPELPEQSPPGITELPDGPAGPMTEPEIAPLPDTGEV